jgi:hypothetical protein
MVCADCSPSQGNQAAFSDKWMQVPGEDALQAVCILHVDS